MTSSAPITATTWQEGVCHEKDLEHALPFDLVWGDILRAWTREQHQWTVIDDENIAEKSWMQCHSAMTATPIFGSQRPLLWGIPAQSQAALGEVSGAAQRQSH